MAVYSTFFISELEQLPVGFPGWKPPLPQPVTRQSINPFTREEMVTTTRAPEWDDFDPGNIEAPAYQVVAIEGDYESYLEQRIPPFVQSRPHWCAKSLTSVELQPLVAAASDVDEIYLESALYAHPSVCADIVRVPDDFVSHIKTADKASLRSLAAKWAAQMSTPEYTHSISGERLYDGWTVDDALSVLGPLAELAQKQTDGQSMFLLVEA